MKLKVIFVGFTVWFSLLSCNDNLSRNEAQNQISDCFQTDCNNQKSKCTLTIRKHWTSDYKSSGNFCSVIITNPPYGKDAEILNLFVQNDLIQIDKEVVYKNCAQWTLNKVKLTRENRKYLVDENDDYYTVISTEYDVSEITGILQKKDAALAMVEYKVKHQNVTPFGEISQQNCLDINQIYRANFVKYDDGWRIQD